MASANGTAVSFDNVRASVQRVRDEGERLLNRIRRDAKALTNGKGRQTVRELLDDAAKLPRDLRRRAEKAIGELDERRTSLLASVEARSQRLAGTVVRRLNLASAEDVQALRKKLDSIERKVNAIAKEYAA